jgi:diguanylate cyclase (GGDEF)-like protein
VTGDAMAGSPTGGRSRPEARSVGADPAPALTADLAVAASSRFRALERHRLRESARHGMVLVGLLAILNTLWLLPFHAHAAGPLLRANVIVSAASLFGYIGVTRLAPRHPERAVFLVAMIVDMATVSLGISDPELGLVAGGYLLLLPAFVALIVPWATRIHVAWLATHVGFVLLYAALAARVTSTGTPRLDTLMLLVVATSVSVFGHLAALDARVLSFVQIQRIRALNREARRVEARLDRINGILEHEARTDDLTGLRNRLSLRLDLGSIRSRIARHEERYGLLMLDLDRFKSVNDLSGHVAGDAVLVRVAEALRRAARTGDAVYRYGGEEFVVLVRAVEPDDVAVVAERMRSAIERLAIPHPGNPPHGVVTVSVGSAEFGREDLGTDDAAWLARSDDALYRAKSTGRNTCVEANREVGQAARA